MKNLAVYLTTVIILILFILLMNSADYFKNPEGISDNVNLYFNLINENIKNEQWEAAENNTKKVTRAWTKVVPRIQFSAEKDEISAINTNLARLDAYVSVQDKGNALAELKESLEHWKTLNR